MVFVQRKIIRLLREERGKHGISKYALSQRSGVSQQMLGYVEREIRNPTLEIVLRIADGLDVYLAQIIQRARKSAAKPKDK